MKDFSMLIREPMRVKPASQRAARQKSSVTPDDVYRLNYNESHFGPSPKAVKAISYATEKPYIYPDWMAIDLKKKVASMYGLDISNVVTGSGSSALICMLGEIFLNQKDQVILGDPSYEAFRDVVHDYGAEPVIVPLDSELNYDLDSMLDAITEKTKMIIICNPNNPTGTFIESSKLEAFIKKVPENVITVIDEAYLEYVTKDNTYSMATLLKSELDKPLIVLKTFSKIYAMAGLRIGYALTNAEIADCMSKSSHAWNVSRVGQIAAAASLDDQDFIQSIKEKNFIERQKVTLELEKLGCKVFESQANFILFKSPVDSLVVQEKLAENKILIGAPRGYDRVSLGLPQMNDKFLSVMKTILEDEK